MSRQAGAKKSQVPRQELEKPDTSPGAEPMETDTPIKGRIDINAVEFNPIVTPPRNSGRYKASELAAKRKKYEGVPDNEVWEWPERARRGLLDRVGREDQFQRNQRLVQRVRERILREAEEDNLVDEVKEIFRRNDTRDYKDVFMSINFIKEYQRQEIKDLVLEDGGVITTPVTFNPSSPGSPLTRARNLKLEKLKEEKEYLEARKGARGVYAFETFSDYLASIPPKKEDPDWTDYNFPSAPTADGTESVTESMKRLRNVEETGDGVQREAADSSKPTKKARVLKNEAQQNRAKAKYKAKAAKAHKEMSGNGHQKQLTMSGFAKTSCKSRTKKEEGNELSKFFIQGEDLKMKTPERGAEMKRPVPRFRETPEMVFSESMYVTPKPESKDDKAGTPDWMNDTFVLPRRREDPDNKVERRANQPENNIANMVDNKGDDMMPELAEEKEAEDVGGRRKPHRHTVSHSHSHAMSTGSSVAGQHHHHGPYLCNVTNPVNQALSIVQQLLQVSMASPGRDTNNLLPGLMAMGGIYVDDMSRPTSRPTCQGVSGSVTVETITETRDCEEVDCRDGEDLPRGGRVLRSSTREEKKC